MIEKQQIVMPEGCRYMSEYNELMDYLPVKGWYVLNKTLCGCGGTTVFLESDRDVIIANPNNPTGLAIPVSDIERLVASNKNRMVIIDEAYFDFGKTLHSNYNYLKIDWHEDGVIKAE